MGKEVWADLGIMEAMDGKKYLKFEIFESQCSSDSFGGVEEGKWEESFKKSQ